MEKLKIITFLIFTSVSVMASPTCEQLNKDWSDRYFSEFKIMWTKKEFKCPSNYARIVDTFHHLERIRFRGKNMPNYNQYVKTGLKGIRYKQKHSKWDWAYASEGNGIITLHEGFVTDDDSLQRVQKLIHEARHVRSDDAGHENCERGASKGKNACDKKFEEFFWAGSGYNYGFKFLLYIKEYSYNHELSKEVAARRMKWMVSNRFNKITNEQVRRYSK